jgi:SAM-dependent methyltransferase
LAKEMMFGLEESFSYFECNSCGCLQIVDIPEDMSSYYPDNYYSLATRDSGMPQGLAKLWDHACANFSLKGPNHWLPAVKHREIYGWLKSAGVGFDSSILDVGCGSGALLLRLRNDGFTHLTGYEPHIPETLKYAGNVNVHNEADNVPKPHDLVMLHHSLEHMPDQHQAFKRLSTWVKPGGKLLLRIPVFPNAAWDEYGVDWFQLDAPRHFYLHSVESLRLVAAKAGFEEVSINFDSKGSQFWGSEQYKQGIPHRSPGSHAESPNDSIFSAEQLREYDRKSQKANREQHGDSACFLFEKKHSADKHSEN